MFTQLLLSMFILSPWPQFMHDAQHTGRTQIVVQDSLNIVWGYNHPSGSPWMQAQPVLDDQGNIYYGSGNYFVSIDSSGNQRWSKYTSHVFAGPAAIVGDTVYFGCSEGVLYACNRDGGQFWTFPLVHPVNGGPVIGSDGMIYIGDASDNPNNSHLYAINPDGSEKWVATFDSSGGCYTTPALDPDEDLIYITPGNWYLYAINAASGDTVWRYRSAAAFNVQYSSPSVLNLSNEHYLFFGDLGNLGGHAYWYSIKEDGSFQWQVETNNSIQSTASFSLDHNIYLGCNDGVLRVVDSLGNQKWSESFGCHISDPVIDGNGNVLLGAENGYLYVLDGSSGNIIQQVYIGMSYVGTPVIGDGGKVFVIAGNGNLICLEKNTGIAEKDTKKVRKSKICLSQHYVTFEHLTLGDEIKIYNITGKLVCKSGKVKSSTFKWNIAQNSSGIYFYIIDGKKKSKGKFLIIK